MGVMGSPRVHFELEPWSVAAHGGGGEMWTPLGSAPDAVASSLTELLERFPFSSSRYLHPVPRFVTRVTTLEVVSTDGSALPPLPARADLTRLRRGDAQPAVGDIELGYVVRDIGKGRVIAGPVGYEAARRCRDQRAALGQACSIDARVVERIGLIPVSASEAVRWDGALMARSRAMDFLPVGSGLGI